MKNNRKNKIKPKYILAVLSILCLAGIGFSLFKGASVPTAGTIINSLMAPMQEGINSFGDFTASIARRKHKTAELQSQNEALNDEVEKLQAKLTSMENNLSDYEDLLKLLELSEKYPSYEMTGARIIGKDAGNWYDTFMINKGSKDGIRVDNNVIAGKGLVGIVTEVGSNWATVRSIIDDSSNVSAMTVGTDDNCVVEGDLELIDEGKLRFTQLYDKEDKVTVGEQVVTSNISEKYVEGLFIGYVSDIQLDTNNLTKSGTIVTPVDFQHLKDVFVITVNKKDSTEEGAEE